MELHVVRPIFILLLWGFTLGLKADDLSVIRQKYIESILYKNKSEQQLIRLMCQMSHEKVVGDQMVVELMERCPIEVGYVRQLLSDFDANLLINGKMNPVAYIFRAKNYYGMKDQTESIVKHENNLGETKTADELLEIIEADVIETD